MSKPLKVLLVGVLLSLVVLAIGYMIHKHQLDEMQALVVECQNEKPDPNAPKGPWNKWQKDPLVCELSDLLLVPSTVGVQKQIVDKHYAANDTDAWTKIIAVFVFILFALPYLWHFLLQRIRELGNAIRGK